MKETERDYYDILGISRDATHDEIKRAFRKAAAKYHPDVNHDNPEIFKQIKAAYDVLSDRQLRENYDFVKGYEFERLKEKIYKKKPEVRKDFSQSGCYKYEDILEKTYLKFLKFLKKLKRKENKTNGRNVTMSLYITNKEAVCGCVKKINVLHTFECPVCKGNSFINGTKCSHCNGKGEKSIHKKLSLTVPAGIKSGKTLKLKGEGTKGINGGKDGDLFVKVFVTGKSEFTFNGKTVFSQIEIMPFEAVLGCEKEVNTMNGKVRLKIPPGTSSGQKFRLAGMGLDTKNDQITSVKIAVSKNMSAEEISLYEKLKEIYRKKSKI